MEQTVDMETGEVLAVAVQTMAGGGAASSPVMLEASERGLDRLGLEAREVVADWSCHSNATKVGARCAGAAQLCERAGPRVPEVEEEPARADAYLRELSSDPGRSG
ncbi:MAG: hypothetical protein OYK82_13575 [Gammaproteobacteria bacterium]|nr:hypothetical protein [Gammaproteobacteria bacterium]